MPAKIIAIANQKGGVGKTTTAINVGAYLAKQGHNVLIVDLDPQANTTSGLGVDKNSLKQDLYHSLTGELPLTGIIRATRHKIHLAPASPVLAAAEVELVNQPYREFRLRTKLDNIGYDYVLIDCPPSLGLLTINGLTAATHLLIPVQAEYYALEGLGQLLETVNRIKQALNPNLDLLGVLLTMNDPRTTLSRQVHDELKKHFPGKVFDTIIPRNVKLAEAPSYGKPIHVYDRWSKGAKSYRNLTAEVLARAG